MFPRNFYSGWVLKIKNLVKFFCPPLMLNFFRDLSISGTYPSWDRASVKAKGYSDEKIINQVTQAVELSLNYEDGYARDGIFFDDKKIPLELAAAINFIGNDSDLLVVIDFGGGLGETYRQVRRFLRSSINIMWFIVEQDHFVDVGKASYQTSNLKFFKSMDELPLNQTPNIIIFSGVLQYVKNPLAIISKSIDLGVNWIFVDRTPVTMDSNNIVALQKNSKIFNYSCYPIHIFSEEKLLSYFEDKYDLFTHFNALDGTLNTFSQEINFKGFLFRKKYF